MSYRLLSDGVSSANLVKNLNAEQLNGLKGTAFQKNISGQIRAQKYLRIEWVLPTSMLIGISGQNYVPQGFLIATGYRTTARVAIARWLVKPTQITKAFLNDGNEASCIYIYGYPNQSVTYNIIASSVDSVAISEVDELPETAREISTTIGIESQPSATQSLISENGG